MAEYLGRAPRGFLESGVGSGVMLSFWAVSPAGDCFVVYTFVRKQSPDETNGWQQSHHMIDLAFRLRPVRLLRVWVSEGLTQADS